MNLSVSQQIRLLNDCIHEASRFMQRDFGEIVQLQGTKNGSQDFTHKCYIRIQSRLTGFLNDKFPKVAVITANEPAPKDQQYFFCIEPLSGIDNFQRSVPFFAIAAALFKQEKNLIEPVIFSIHSPILHEVFYAGKGIGSWFENYNETVIPKSRMRVSNKSDLLDAIISTSFPTDLDQTRNLGSHLLEMAYLAAGRIDILIHRTESLLTQGAFMMIREAGGYVKQQENICLASNDILKKVASEMLKEIELG